MTLPCRIVAAAHPADLSRAEVRREFLGRLAEGRLRPVGRAKQDPQRLLTRAYMPRCKLELFDTTLYLSDVRQNPDVRFFVAYVAQEGSRDIHPRLLYKDVSLVWRCASHMIRTDGENWIGKGDLRTIVEDGVALEVSAEETTDLPLEIQDAMEALSRRAARVPRDDDALALVLREAPADRLEPYRDFSAPRRRAAADPSNRIHGGRPIARFTRKNDPTSLRFVAGYEPDFGKGVLEQSRSKSSLYGGTLRRFRVLSRNRRIQYLFFAAPRQAWVVPPQATTTELSTYAVRTIDVIVPEELCIPGYEYHFMDDSCDPPELHSQIPDGFVGEAAEGDPSRSDASPWLDQLPVIREFRRALLRGRSG